MGRLGTANVLRLFLRGSRNYVTGRPLVVSFELTGSCNARCKHCDKGGILKDETPLSPARIGAVSAAVPLTVIVPSPRST